MRVARIVSLAACAAAGTMALKPVASTFESFRPPSDLYLARCRMTKQEITRLETQIRQMIRTPPPRGDIKVFYTRVGMAHVDGFIPISHPLASERPDTNALYRWVFSRGRLGDVEYILDGGTQLTHRIWHNRDGAPQLCVQYGKDGKPSGFAWGDYDPKGYLVRRCVFSEDYTLQRLTMFVNMPGYAATDEYEFDTDSGHLTSARFQRDRKQFSFSTQRDPETGKEYGLREEGPFRWNRIERLNELVPFGLDSIYPIPKD